MSADDLTDALTKARALFPGLRGAFGWQWGSDTKGTWVAKLAQAFAPAP